MNFNSLGISKNKKIKQKTKKQIYMKIELQNSIVRLSFLCHITNIKIAWINPSNCKTKYIEDIK